MIAAVNGRAFVIHKDKLLTARLPAKACLSDEPCDLDWLVPPDRLNFEQSLDQFIPVKIADPIS